MWRSRPVDDLQMFCWYEADRKNMLDDPNSTEPVAKLFMDLTK